MDNYEVKPLLLSRCLKLSTNGWSINERMLRLDTSGISYYTDSKLDAHQISMGKIGAKKGASMAALESVKSLCDNEDLK
jgi:hypothetical protein